MKKNDYSRNYIVLSSHDSETEFNYEFQLFNNSNYSPSSSSDNDSFESSNNNNQIRNVGNNNINKKNFK